MRLRILNVPWVEIWMLAPAGSGWCKKNTSSSTMNFKCCILRHLHNPVSMQKHAKKRGIWISNHSCLHVALEHVFCGLSFSQFDERTCRFNLRSIAVSYCDWGAAILWCPRVLHSLHWQRALLGAWTHQIVAGRPLAVPRLVGPPKIPGVHLVFRLAWFFCQNSATKYQLYTALPDPHMKHSLESGPLWRSLKVPSMALK